MLVDKDCASVQRVYAATADYINDKVPGKNFADRVEELRLFWQKNHNRMTVELIIDDIVDAVTARVKEENGNR